MSALSQQPVYRSLVVNAIALREQGWSISAEAERRCAGTWTGRTQLRALVRVVYQERRDLLDAGPSHGWEDLSCSLCPYVSTTREEDGSPVTTSSGTTELWAYRAIPPSSSTIASTRISAADAPAEKRNSPGSTTKRIASS